MPSIWYFSRVATTLLALCRASPHANKMRHSPGPAHARYRYFITRRHTPFCQRCLCLLLLNGMAIIYRRCIDFKHAASPLYERRPHLPMAASSDAGMLSCLRICRSALLWENIIIDRRWLLAATTILINFRLYIIFSANGLSPATAVDAEPLENATITSPMPLLSKYHFDKIDALSYRQCLFFIFLTITESRHY